MSIREMVEAGLIKAGSQNVTVTYKGVTYKADITRSGQIQYGGTS